MWVPQSMFEYQYRMSEKEYYVVGTTAKSFELPRYMDSMVTTSVILDLPRLKNGVWLFYELTLDFFFFFFFRCRNV